MKALVFDKSVSPSIPVFREMPKPVPGKGQVLVKIVAASLNALDYRPIQMGFGFPKNRVMGADMAGIVETAGADCAVFHPGDAVFGDLSAFGYGAFAEYVAVSEAALALLPATVTFEQGAALPVAALTALQGLRKGGIRPGQKVLINGTGGGVGTYALQLAKHFGAEVTAVCGAKNVETAKMLGAEVVLDYAKEDFTEKNQRYDLILAVNGYHPLSAYRRALAPGGIYVMIGGTMPQILKSLFWGPLMSMGHQKFRSLAANSNRKDLEYMAGLVGSGAIRPVIGRLCSLEEAPEAFRILGEGHAAGKVVISIFQDRK